MALIDFFRALSFSKKPNKKADEDRNFWYHRKDGTFSIRVMTPLGIKKYSHVRVENDSARAEALLGTLKGVDLQRYKKSPLYGKVNQLTLLDN